MRLIPEAFSTLIIILTHANPAASSIHPLLATAPVAFSIHLQLPVPKPFLSLPISSTLEIFDSIHPPHAISPSAFSILLLLLPHAAFHFI